MTYRQGVISGVAGTFLLVAAGLGGWWLLAGGKPAQSAPKPAPPASVGQILKEEQITGLKLTAEAEKRLGIETAPVAIRDVRRTRVYGGEVTVPPGCTMVVSAPIGGIVRTPEGGVPVAGKPVKKGDTVLLLAPLLTPEARTTLATARADAEGRAEAARADAEVKKLALDRARRLFEQQAGSRRAYEEAQATHEIAVRTQVAARAQRDLLVKIAGEVEKGTATPLPMTAPEDGILRALNALPGQNVPAGGGLFEVVDLRRVWIRVPVYVGDLADIASGEAARVGSPAFRRGEATCVAEPAEAPPSASPLAATADLFYELPIREGALAPGQRVGVAVPLRGADTGPTVPWSAVVHDIHGGTWVYEKTAPLSYVRRRVQVSHVVGEHAVLAGMPAVGAEVVVAGAAELFGTEVGFSK